MRRFFMKKADKSKKNNFMKELLSMYPVTVAAIAVCCLMCLVMFFFDYRAALIELVFPVGLAVFGLVRRALEKNRLHGLVKTASRGLSAAEEGELISFPLPAVIFDSLEKILWYNRAFKREFIFEKVSDCTDITQFTSGQGIEKIRENTFIECEFDGKSYTAFSSHLEYRGETVYALYFIENTELKSYKERYENTRPVVIIINVDGVDERLSDFRESQVAEISGGVETIIENWFTRYDCLVRKTGSGRFLVIAENDGVARMKADKFSVLSLVRSYTYNGKSMGLSLSVGVGTGNTLPQCERSARQALDMAMGRGGDQAAVRNKNNEYEFFGGVAKGIEKRTKVRTRIMASAIGQTIKTADNVLVMGHRFADLDALGSAVGMVMICRALGKTAHVVMSSKTTLAMPLVKYLQANGMGDMLIEPEAAQSRMGGQTLLIIVDTHRQSFLDYPELFDAASRVVVIDHHRKTVDHINKAVIFYHEPNASSASEMVTELIEYTDIDVDVPKACAEALLSGITLDTKNFVMNTGVRTFEAAAYLRSKGADTVTVKQLFSNSMKTQKEKSEVMKSAVIYKDCAVGVVDFESDGVRIVASQAADELLNVDGVCASFVLFRSNDEISISARSYGEINVQLVMEKLGGGGHQTMAAVQLKNETFENVLSMLKNAIDTVAEENE